MVDHSAKHPANVAPMSSRSTKRLFASVRINNYPNANIFSIGGAGHQMDSLYGQQAGIRGRGADTKSAMRSKYDNKYDFVAESLYRIHDKINRYRGIRKQKMSVH